MFVCLKIIIVSGIASSLCSSQWHIIWFFDWIDRIYWINKNLTVLRFLSKLALMCFLLLLLQIILSVHRHFLQEYFQVSQIKFSGLLYSFRSSFRNSLITQGPNVRERRASHAAVAAFNCVLKQKFWNDVKYFMYTNEYTDNIYFVY